MKSEVNEEKNALMQASRKSHINKHAGNKSVYKGMSEKKTRMLNISYSAQSTNANDEILS
jgi:hypothetical protein